jgi:hypothetical protein
VRRTFLNIATSQFYNNHLFLGENVVPPIENKQTRFDYSITFLPAQTTVILPLKYLHNELTSQYHHRQNLEEWKYSSKKSGAISR